MNINPNHPCFGGSTERHQAFVRKTARRTYYRHRRNTMLVLAGASALSALVLPITVITRYTGFLTTGFLSLGLLALTMHALDTATTAHRRATSGR